MKVCRLRPALSSTAGTPGASDSSPTVSVARCGRVPSNQVRTSSGVAGRMCASWNGSSASRTVPLPTASRTSMSVVPPVAGGDRGLDRATGQVGDLTESGTGVALEGDVPAAPSRNPCSDAWHSNLRPSTDVASGSASRSMRSRTFRYRASCSVIQTSDSSPSSGDASACDMYDPPLARRFPSAASLRCRRRARIPRGV